MSARFDAQDADAAGRLEFAWGEAVVLVEVGFSADEIEDADVGSDADEFGAGDFAVAVGVHEEEAAFVAAGVDPFDEGDLAVVVGVGYLEGIVGVGRGESLQGEGHVPFRRVFGFGLAGGQQRGCGGERGEKANQAAFRRSDHGPSLYGNEEPWATAISGSLPTWGAFGVDAPSSARTNRGVFARFVAFGLLWLVLDHAKPAGLLIGLPAAALAAWVSVRLLPAGGARLRWRALPAFAGHFLWDSVVAGVDVARRAFHPQLPLRTGFVEVSCGLPPGPQRDGFLAVASLMPGSLPVGDDGTGVTLHCLDVEHAVAGQMAALEQRMNHLVGDGHA